MIQKIAANLFCGTLVLTAGLLNAQESALESETSTRKEQNTMTDSVLLKPWTGPYGGVPPWDKVRPEEMVAAFDAAIEMTTDEIQAIADNPEPATFENTVVAMENSGRALDRLDAIFGVYASNLNLGPVPDIERVVAPKLSAHSDSIYQNEKLFARLKAIYDSDAKSSLTVAQRRLIDDLYKTFVRRGSQLNSRDKARLSQINSQLARLFTDFSQNVLEDEKGYVTWVDSQADLAGLPTSVIAAMKRAAIEREKPDQWAVTNTRSSMDPFLTYAQNRPLREQVWRTYYNRCDNGDDHDNNALITEILGLRRERAKLLGYPTHAHWRLEPTMAKTPEATEELMNKVWSKAVARVHEEVADMQQIADQETDGKVTIEPWDYRFYAEKVRKAKYDLDLGEVKPYLQMEKLREGMFWVAGELFGLTFEPATDVPVFHPDVRVWQVRDRDGQPAGLWYFDPYARAGKRSGAWMTAYRVQENMGQPRTPIVSNNSNFIPGGEDETVLISWDDAVTLFHEFGHALHGLCSDVKYPSQAGTAVARDYVEFPSQLLEHWLDTPEVMQKYCLHHETGEPLPQELIDKIKKASTFNQGFATVEYLASAIMDMKLHTSDQTQIDPDTFERQTLEEIGMPAELPMRHRTPHFSHIFSSDSYSAGYYSYLWADALTADAAEAFEEAGSFYDPALSKSLYENVFKVGDTIDAADGFRAFRGRDVDTGALLRKRGFSAQE
ncbi:M3 family metallopeptidase [Stieleria sp. TO1_6]|uniref:M3 family metallopeptidase n=1 Tax=Stieleria tagensis TaxID=2956795 RepID=UPI00209B5DA4|nr:M3 family metallopeptidase [Stieleria tagensis]MCO8122124.1 M3 family metallopeptidase [Stieleria tagensis]